MRWPWQKPKGCKHRWIMVDRSTGKELADDILKDYRCVRKPTKLTLEFLSSTFVRQVCIECEEINDTITPAIEDLEKARGELETADRIWARHKEGASDA